jgi:serine/threonine protein kinase
MKVCPRCSEFYANDATYCPSDGVELKKTNDPWLGRTIAARYRLIKRLGTGGMSSVYLARHVMIDRLSAIKVLRQDLSLNPTHRERFLREARAVNRINHRNIVEISDAGEMDGVAYLVMEYVDGKSLHEEIRKGAMPWPRAARIGMQISAALARAHQMGVIHRDLKPENILLVRVRDGDAGAEHDLAKLTDFGIAKIVDAPALTFSEQLFGTPGYIAPEYVEGLPVDRRADLYALGVLIYEMTTGALPYDARGADLLTMPLRAAPTPPGQRVSGLPPEIETLTLRLLARQPEDRPQDAFAVYDALGDTLRRYGGGSMLPPAYTTEPPVARDAAPTIVDEEVDIAVSSAMLGSIGIDIAPASRLTANLAKAQTSEIALRWHTALAELELSIERARRKGGPAARGAEKAVELVEYARTKVVSIERASRAAAEAQARVDRLEAKGREFRANLGHAIDELLRDLSRERAHAAALSTRREALVDSAPGRGQDRSSDTLVWETAALAAEEERARALESDLTFQIDALQAQLDTQNHELEAELVEASGGLEGSLAALRQLTNEFVRTLDDAAAVVGVSK